MTSEGPNSPSSATSTAIGDRPWANPSNALASDDARATSTSVEPGERTDGLDLTGFGFDLPAGASVLGVEVAVEARGEGETVVHSIRLLVGGSPVGDSKNSSLDPPEPDQWTFSEDVYVYGADDDTWNLSLTREQVNASGFGVRVQAQLNDPETTAMVDHVTITVHYEEGEGIAGTQRLLLGVG